MRPGRGPLLLLAALALLALLAPRVRAALAEPPGLTPPFLAPPVLTPKVRARLPHDPSAFTQGLVFHQGALYESTGLYGRSSLRRTDPATGRVLAQTRLPDRLFGEGLAASPPRPGAAPRLAQLTWREGLILTYDLSTLRQTGTHPLRGEGWGLAFDGARLIASDGSDILRLLEPGRFAETGRLAVREGARPVQELNELEWAGGWLLANVLGQDRIAVIRPPGARDAGQVAAWLDLSALRRELSPRAEAANGVAFDPAARALYVTGKRWDTVFVLEPPELLARPPDAP